MEQANIQDAKLEEPNDAANTLIEAFKVNRKDAPKDAIRCLDVMIQRYALQGTSNFSGHTAHFLF